MLPTVKIKYNPFKGNGHTCRVGNSVKCASASLADRRLTFFTFLKGLGRHGSKREVTSYLP